MVYINEPQNIVNHDQNWPQLFLSFLFFFYLSSSLPVYLLHMHISCHNVLQAQQCLKDLRYSSWNPPPGPRKLAGTIEQLRWLCWTQIYVYLSIVYRYIYLYTTIFMKQCSHRLKCIWFFNRWLVVSWYNDNGREQIQCNSIIQWILHQ